MKTFRRIAAAAVALVMALSMAACSTDNGKTQIGIIQLMDHPALNSAREGFIAALEEEGYKDGENIEITYQNGQGEANNLSTIADKFIGDKMDLVLAIATPAAQAVAGKTTTIPIIATAVTDFAEAGLVNSNDNPGTNVSGTNDMNPIESQLDLMFQLCPDVQTSASSTTPARITPDCRWRLPKGFWTPRESPMWSAPLPAPTMYSRQLPPLSRSATRFIFPQTMFWHPPFLP